MERYNKEYSYGKVRFTLLDFSPTLEQCRFLMLKVLEQAVREYCIYAKAITPNEKETWTMAKAFLFDDNYRFNWGDLELSLEDFLDIIDLDIDWVREQTQKKFKKDYNG